jgi:hypothetical protein
VRHSIGRECQPNTKKECCANEMQENSSHSALQCFVLKRFEHISSLSPPRSVPGASISLWRVFSASPRAPLPAQHWNPGKAKKRGREISGESLSLHAQSKNKKMSVRIVQQCFAAAAAGSSPSHHRRAQRRFRPGFKGSGGGTGNRGSSYIDVATGRVVNIQIAPAPSSPSHHPHEGCSKSCESCQRRCSTASPSSSPSALAIKWYDPEVVFDREEGSEGGEPVGTRTKQHVAADTDSVAMRVCRDAIKKLNTEIIPSSYDAMDCLYLLGLLLEEEHSDEVYQRICSLKYIEALREGTPREGMGEEKREGLCNLVTKNILGIDIGL